MQVIAGGRANGRERRPRLMSIKEAVPARVALPRWGATFSGSDLFCLCYRGWRCGRLRLPRLPPAILLIPFGDFRTAYCHLPTAFCRLLPLPPLLPEDDDRRDENHGEVVEDISLLEEGERERLRGGDK